MKNSRTKLILGLISNLAAILASTPVSAQNPLKNGGFESHVPIGGSFPYPQYGFLTNWMTLGAPELGYGNVVGTPQGMTVVHLRPWRSLVQGFVADYPNMMMVYEAAGRPNGVQRQLSSQSGVTIYPSMHSAGKLFSIPVAAAPVTSPPTWRTLAGSLTLPANMPPGQTARFSLATYESPFVAGATGCYYDDVYLIPLNTVAHSGGFLSGVAVQNNSPSTGHPFLTQFNSGSLIVQNDPTFKASVTIVGIAPAANSTSGFSVRWSARAVSSTAYQRLALYDWTTESWDVGVAQPSAPVQLPQVLTSYARFIPGSVFANYFEPGTGRVLARIEWNSRGWTPGPLFPFTVEVDNIRFQ